jgi:hypothetical protein
MLKYQTLLIDINVTAAAMQTQILLCRTMLGSNPGQLRLQHRLSGALTTRLDLIQLG